MPPLMLTDDEAVAVLLGLLTSRSADRPAAAARAADSATAKLRRVLPPRLTARLDALINTAEFTADDRPEVAVETAVLLRLAEATRERRPVAIGYTDRNGQASERTVHPYGLVDHSGRWYLTGKDNNSDELRQFRLDRITAVTTARNVHCAHRIRTGRASPVRIRHRALSTRRIDPSPRHTHPAPPAAPRDDRDHARDRLTTPDTRPWVRVRIRAEQLDWIPPVLAGLNRPFVIEHPDTLNDAVRALARRLTAAADGRN
ncbi:YafY family protein [Nocardia sp. XZ_19_369]|uniref:helix-turn-helix transcriptional regulator n=1 Tax=Nocardia sp. XZ_19_369 TaxID=2769487 RepID=UPI001E34FF26|nr:WYL domain-containing protein [Nocardia sp. XZ_19_369]